MSACNMENLMSLSCNELREKRARLDASIADDKCLNELFVHLIRQIEILIAERQLKIERLRRRPSEPALREPSDQDGQTRQKTPDPVDTGLEVIPVTADSPGDPDAISRLEKEIGVLDETLSELRLGFSEQVDHINEAVARRASVRRAMRAKGCVHA